MRSYSDDLIQWQDFIFAPLWMVIIIMIAYIWKQKYYGKSPIANYFIPALVIRLISGMIAGLVVEYYYGGIGDTKGYFINTLALRYEFETGIKTLSECISFYDSTTAVTAIGFPIIYLTNNTYLAATLFFTSFSFIGGWRLYKVFLYFYPHLYRPLAYCILFLPSICYWGSGIIKDPLSFGGLGIMLYALHNIIFKGKKILLNVIIVVLSAWLIYVIKAYILVASIPAIGIWFSIHFSTKFKSPVIRLFVLPLLVIISLFVAEYIIQSLTNTDSISTSSYGSKTVLKGIEAQQNAYAYGEQGGSYSSLGEYDGSITSLIGLFPLAVISSFFRPFPWEIKNVLMVFSALENIILLYLLIKVFANLGMSQIFNLVKLNPFLVFCLLFSITFAGFVGASTPNLGTLARYKIPCLPFIWLVVIVLNEKVQEKKIVRKRFLTKELIHG